jgi:hypothetical protein
LNKTLKSLEKLPLCTKKFSQAKYLNEKFKEVKEAVKRKIFNLTHSSGSGSGSSGEGEMIAQISHNRKKERKGSHFDSSSKELVS